MPSSRVSLKRWCSWSAIKTTKPELQSLDVDSALKRLMKDIYADETSVIERHRRALVKLLQTQAYTLNYSGEPAKAVEVIQSILNSSHPRHSRG